MNDKDFRNIHNTLYGVYGVNTFSPQKEEKWYNFMHKIRLLTHSISDLNKCGIVVDYDNRNEIIHKL